MVRAKFLISQETQEKGIREHALQGAYVLVVKGSCCAQANERSIGQPRILLDDLEIVKERVTGENRDVKAI